MNLLDEDYSNNKENKTKKMIPIIIVLIVIILMAIIGIVSYMMYLQGAKLRVYVNDVQNADVKNLLHFEEDGTIYVPIRAIASYLGYNSFNGEYKNKSEEQSKCYVECTEEVANLTLNSNKIYKLNLEDNDNNYTYVYMDKPVKAIEGELYITTDGMQKAFNSSFFYNEQNNTITIYTTPYLINAYTNTILDYGYTKLSETFDNEKTAIRNMLVVSDDRYYGVINVNDGTEILECKYDDIKYQEATGDFIVCSDDKYGIIGVDKKTKVSIDYDSIELMDYDAGLYLVSRNDHFGVIDLNGHIVIHTENDQIGVDISKFANNDLKTGYILIDKLIPVQKNDKWGLFDTDGHQLVEFEYDSFGYVAGNIREAQNLLVIPSYNLIVACMNDRYTLLNSLGEQPIRAFVDDIYMQIDGGEKQYYMIANDKKYNVEEYLDRLGVIQTESNNSNTTNTSNTNSDSTSNNINNNETNNTENTNQMNNTANEEDNGQDEDNSNLVETQNS